MRKLFRWRDHPSNDEISLLDSYLQRTLIPVLPSQDFVRELQSRLISESFSPDGIRNLRIVQYILVTTGVLAGVSILMITGIRVLIGIFGLVGLIQNISSQQEPRPGS